MTGTHFLTNIFRPEKFSAEELETIIPNYKMVEFFKNDFLVKEGKTASQYWFVESGWTRSYVSDADGKDFSTNFYGAGDIVIDWPSFFLRQPSRENIQALTNCRCWQISFEAFQQLFNSIEAFREQGRTALVGSFFALKQQSIAMIADKAIDRYKKLVNGKPEIARHVSLKHIATYLGVTDTSLSRIRKEIAGG